MVLLLLLLLLVGAVSAAPPQPPPGVAPATFPPHLVGNASAVVDLLERFIPYASLHINFFITPKLQCAGYPAGKACFTIADSSNGTKLVITATSASELTGGLGVYLREHCHMTIGWRRGMK